MKIDTKVKKTNKALSVPNQPNWCPGCGNFGIWTAFRDAAVQEGWDNGNTAMIAGIGCHGHILNFTPLSGFEGLHGRAIPLASGVKMANQDLNVFVFTGDGDCLAEGGNHLVHAARRNQDITVILHDNAVYGLTTGQTSPRSPRGFKSKSTPDGASSEPIQPLRLAIASGATFAARAFSGNVQELTALIKRANAHRGFAIIDILQPCVTFNKDYSHAYYQNNIRPLKAKHDPSDRLSALAETYEWGEKNIPVGVFYEKTEFSCEEQLAVIRRRPDKKLSGKARPTAELWKSFA
jgi:2-oxoglutarate/2-oxoacid ferredoxin oxidoreductase subunit beta